MEIYSVKKNSYLIHPQILRENKTAVALLKRINKKEKKNFLALFESLSSINFSQESEEEYFKRKTKADEMSTVIFRSKHRW